MAACTSILLLAYSRSYLAVMFLYDSILITGDEMRCFWGRKITAATVLFWLNKYVMAFGLVWSIGTSLNISDEVCVTWFNNRSLLLKLIDGIPSLEVS